MESPPKGAVDIIRDWMKSAGVKQRSLSELTGIHATTVNLVLNNKRPVTRGVLERLAKATNLDFNELQAAERKIEQWKKSPEGKRSEALEKLADIEEFSSHPFLSEGQIKAYLDAGVFAISPVDGLVFGPARIKLSRGDCQLFRNGQEIEITTEDLELLPGESARVRSLQTLQLSSRLACEVDGLKLHHADGVVLHRAAPIEPPFDDQVTVILQNLGVTKFLLSRDEPCISVRFYSFLTNSK